MDFSFALGKKSIQNLILQFVFFLYSCIFPLAFAGFNKMHVFAAWFRLHFPMGASSGEKPGSEENCNSFPLCVSSSRSSRSNLIFISYLYHSCIISSLWDVLGAYLESFSVYFLHSVPPLSMYLTCGVLSKVSRSFFDIWSVSFPVSASG